MTDIEQRASQLQTRIAGASYQERIALQPQLDRVISTLKAQGHPVPSKLKRLGDKLRDEAMDDMFDNMPV
ncbi:hypothetical protein [uncultured Roseobacter sp.]|uniref:hypothetical protein n=1 Tax=uncultured Roseobacter sp. TaxID=114847 RepID=UPI002630E131|nr:hypothetical protein [uncultured Roseobacter sp.]